MEYSEKLKDPRWQKKRLEIFSRDNWTCTKCGDSKSTLHVHHYYYSKGLDPWDYPSKSLTTLCESCHELETELSKTLSLLKKLKSDEGIIPEPEGPEPQYVAEERLRYNREIEDQELSYNMNILFMMHLERLEREKEERLNAKRAEAIERRKLSSPL